MHHERAPRTWAWAARPSSQLRRARFSRPRAVAPRSSPRAPPSGRGSDGVCRCNTTDTNQRHRIATRLVRCQCRKIRNDGYDPWGESLCNHPRHCFRQRTVTPIARSSKCCIGLGVLFSPLLTFRTLKRYLLGRDSSHRCLLPRVARTLAFKASRPARPPLHGVAADTR